MYSNGVLVTEQQLMLQTLTYFSKLHGFFLKVRILGKMDNMLLLLLSIINWCAHHLC